MSELLRVLADEDVDDEALQEAAAAAEAVLEVRGVDVEAVVPGPATREELELIVTPVNGDTRRTEISPNPDPGPPFVLSEGRYTGCAWDPQGTERLERVELNGRVWHEADVADEGVVDGP